MSLRTASRRPALAVAALLVLPAGLQACTDGDQGGPSTEGDSVAGMIALVPDSAAAQAYAVVSLYAKAEEAVDLEVDGEAGASREARRITLLTADVGTGTGVAGGPLAAGDRSVERYEALGYVPSDIRAEVVAGGPPEQVGVAVGDLDPDVILDAAEETDGAERNEVDGVEVVSWLGDDEVDPDLGTPVGDLPGQAGRVAVPTDGVLTYTNSDDTTQAVLDAVEGDGDSLADVDDLATVADALDDRDVHSALLSTTPVSVDPRAQTREGAEEMATDILTPYRALGTGAAIEDGRPRMVVVVVHDSDGDAEDNVERLERQAADGRSAATGGAWSELLTDPVIDREGAVVTASFAVENPALWLQIVLQRDNLLAAG